MPDWFKDSAWMKRRRERMRYFRSIPMRRLWALMLAAFTLFAATGFLIQLMNRGSAPVEITLLWVVWSGVWAVLYILVLARVPKYLPALIVVQVLTNLFLAWVQGVIMRTLPLHHIAPELGMKVYSGVAYGLVIVSYVLFFVFIHSEGQEAIRNATELELARGIQSTLVPPLSLRDSRVDLFAVSLPSARVGGDLVDMVADGQTLFLYVGDISGHGLQAGILMGMLKAAVRSQLIERTSTTRLLHNLNEVLPAVKESSMYATLAALRLVFSPEPDEVRDARPEMARRSGAVRGFAEYALAGHPAILHFRAGATEVMSLAQEELPLGLMPVGEYATEQVEFASGDVFVLATDGVSEVEDEQSRAFGMEGITRCVQSAAGRRSAEEMVQAIVQDVRAFGRQTDDQTVLCVRIL